MSDSGDRPAGAPRARAYGHLFAHAAVLGAIAAALWVLKHRLAGYPWHRLGDDLSAIGPGPLALALLATAASYGIMVGYDALALSYVDHSMPHRRYATASFVATAFGNSLGASAFVGAALRARLYSAWGLPGAAIARVAAFNLITLSLGSSVLVAAGLAWAPPAVLAWLPVNRFVSLLGALALLAGVGGYVLWCGRTKPPVTVRGHKVDRPTRTMAVTQVSVSVLEWLTMAVVLHVLLPDGHGLAFVPFAVLFVLATTLGLLSNVPGGLGVVEAVLVVALADTVPPTGLVTALVAYRLAYYLVPLGLAAVVLAVLEAKRSPDRAAGAARLGRSVVPSLLAVPLIVTGLRLVLTGELPDGQSLGHGPFVGGLAGTALLVLARGVYRRLLGAWALTVIAVGLLSAAGPEPLVPGVVLVLLLGLARPGFYRTTSVLRTRWGAVWTALTVGLAASLVSWNETWLVPTYGDRTWWGVLTGDGAAVDRIGPMVLVAALVLVGTRLQLPVSGPHLASDAELDRAVPVMARATTGNASLLWSGDKRVLFSANGNALLMYQVAGRSWVVMGDPVGDEREFAGLVDEFLRLCRRRCGRPMLYCVRDDLAAVYEAQGLVMVKLGEEAMIPLTDFTMTGSKRAKLRSECRASTKAGVEVEVLEGDAVRAALPALREVSDLWLDDRKTREKSFSLGHFDDEFVARYPVAVARIDDQVVAFATLWASGAQHEIKVDLMRRRSEAPRTVMTHLFVEAMLWAQERGFDTFSIGMTPLSGLRTDGPFWERVGNLVWTYGEHFYNFRGLRQFKDRFDPQWEPRYVASHAGPAFPVMMIDVAALVAGGFRGLVPALHAPLSRSRPAATPAPVAAPPPSGPSEPVAAQSIPRPRQSAEDRQRQDVDG